LRDLAALMSVELGKLSVALPAPRISLKCLLEESLCIVEIALLQKILCHLQ
jgi:hypothetical protein